MIADLTPIQRSAVRLAVRRTRRIWIDADDREQDAAEAVLRARLDETRTDAEQAAYLARRAVGAILDEMSQFAHAAHLYPGLIRLGAAP